jgi:hypothetical protein
MTSLSRNARVAGLLYLLTGVLGPIRLMCTFPNAARVRQHDGDCQQHR